MSLLDTTSTGERVRQLPSVYLPAALRRLGVDIRETDVLTYGLARKVAHLVGIPVYETPNLVDRVRQQADLPRVVMAKLAERFPDLVVHPGRLQGRAITPVEVRLRRLLESIPDGAKAAGLALNDLRTRLAGRYGRTARADDAANALRSLGWVRVRSWRDAGGGFRSYWYPPDAPAAVDAVTKPKRRYNKRRDSVFSN